MHTVEIVIGLGWVAFWIYWLAAAMGVKAGRPRSAPFIGLRVGLPLVIIVLLRLRVFKAHTTATDPWLAGIGLALFVLGLGLAVWARVYLGRNWGMPMTQKEQPELVTTGPYHRVRHPIYTGILLAMIGTTLAVSLYLLLVVVIIGAYFVYSAFAEERFMASRFPDSYPAYMRSTKMLVPFVF